MTKAAALQQFFASFGLDAYAETAVPEHAQLPYLSYNLVSGALGDGECSITVNLWYYTKSEATPNAKAEAIGAKLGMGGIMVPYSGGAVWLKRGSPFCQSIREESDDKIKRRYINISAEFISAS